MQQWVRLQLAWLERLPAALKLILPPVFTCLAWLALAPLFARLGLIPPLQNGSHALQQGVVIGLGTWLTWKWLLIGILALHLVNSHVYFGQSPFWNFIAVTGGNLLAPLRRLPLRVARIDLAPIVAIIMVSLLAASALNGMEFKLRGSTWHVPGLTELFNRLPF